MFRLPAARSSTALPASQLLMAAWMRAVSGVRSAESESTPFSTLRAAVKDVHAAGKCGSVTVRVSWARRERARITAMVSLMERLLIAPLKWPRVGLPEVPSKKWNRRSVERHREQSNVEMDRARLMETDLARGPVRSRARTCHANQPGGIPIRIMAEELARLQCDRLSAQVIEKQRCRPKGRLD